VIRAVVFDFDGVIANSEPLHFRAFGDVLADEDVPLTESDYYSRYLGYDDQGVFEAIAVDRAVVWSTRQIADLVARKAARLLDLERGGSLLFPGAVSAVRRLAAACPLAIASGARRPEIVRVLDGAGLAAHFTAIVSCEDTAAGKPAPDPYRRALELLSRATGAPIAPGDSVAVEDSRWGIESARAAGMLTVAVTHTYGAADLPGADALVDHLDALTWDFLVALRRRD